MKTQKVVLKNETGLHARPASELAKIAAKYQSTINLIIEGSSLVKNSL